jgi:AAA15 family ATPase/GTPase
MLIRLTLKNILSFGEEREFNLLPAPRLTRLGEHVYKVNGTEVLKLSAIYGANGAGKSNLIKVLQSLVSIVRNGDIPVDLIDSKFKLSKQNDELTQIIGIEFIINNKNFYYGIEFDNGIILTEELYRTNTDKKNELLLFERKSDDTGKSTTRFNDDFEHDKESRTLKSVIEKTLLKPEKSIFKLLHDLDNDFLIEIKEAYRWFQKNVQIIQPSSKPKGIAHQIDVDETFKDFANKIMCSFGTGIRKIETERKSLREFFGEDEYYEKVSKELKKDPKRVLGLINKSGEEIIAVNENDELIIKRLVLKHQGDTNEMVDFYLENESDGTNRLLDYIPAFQEIVSENRVYIIDEIERSIHPLLIKELIKKFSLDPKTKGQLIFTTHESNLLDQGLFRQDEIWFIEKDNLGCSDMYPLSDFKEHHTKNIKKGYLTGRYGAIPFLGNLKDLNWSEYAAS